MSNIYGKATVWAFQAISGEDFFDDDDIFTLTIIPNWTRHGKDDSTYYFVSLISDEFSGPYCSGRYWGHLDQHDLELFVRESVVNYYSRVYGVRDEGWLEEAANDLVIRYL